jgi:hypothetical protein
MLVPAQIVEILTRTGASVSWHCERFTSIHGQYFAKSSTLPLRGAKLSLPLWLKAPAKQPQPKAAKTDPRERVTNTGVVRGHLLRPEQALQFACVVADRLHVIGCDLQQPASALAMAT